jgi:hypothetical protein
LAFFLALSAFAANVKLYLKDGDFHLVREYKVEADRVKYYSVERADWEEIPLALVDLKRTETEAKEHQAAIEEDAKLVTAEEKAEREQVREVARIPTAPGVYLVVGNVVNSLPQGESQMHNNKGRSVLKVLSPIPTVSGLATVEMKGEHSPSKISSAHPEFYFVPSDEESYGIIKLTPAKTIRIVENLTIAPITKEVKETRDEIEVFRQQMDDKLFKIWPTKPLEPGEYAVVEFTEGKVNMQIWDFAYDPKATQALDAVPVGSKSKSP